METLAIYAQDLSSYDLEVISAVLDDFGLEAPKQFTSLWPAVGVFLEAIKAKIKALRPSQESIAAAKWNAYVALCKAEGIEGPDEELKERIAKLNEKMGVTR